jgi:Fe-S cluster assembly ATP-binding protein
MAERLLEIRDLHVAVGDTEIIRGVNLQIDRGSVHALMGPNGSGKSTLSLALMGHPKYKITKGDIQFKGQSILELAPNERSLLGMFLGFQYPSAVPGVSVANFLRNALMARHKGSAPLTPAKFKKLLDDGVAKLKMDPAVLGRYVNDGFSGGEKKRLEILQALVLEPDLEILDETAVHSERCCLFQTVDEVVVHPAKQEA